MTVRTLPDTDRSGTVPVTAATPAEYDPHALLAEIVIRLELAGLLPKGQPLPDPRGATRAAASLLRAIGVEPVDWDMSHRVAKRVAALAGEGR